MDDDWELCYDDGFVYKRRKKQHHESSAVAADSSNSESEAQQRRDRKKKILVGLREQYGREIQQWERLMAALHHLENNTQADSSLLPLTAFDKYTPQQIREGEGGCQLLIIDEILQKVDLKDWSAMWLSFLINLQAELWNMRKALINSQSLAFRRLKLKKPFFKNC